MDKTSWTLGTYDGDEGAPAVEPDVAPHRGQQLHDRLHHRGDHYSRGIFGIVAGERGANPMGKDPPPLVMKMVKIWEIILSLSFPIFPFFKFCG